MHDHVDVSIRTPDGRTTVIEKQTVLPHPADDVFAALMSPEIAPLIDPAVRTWEPDRRPIGVGTEFRIRGRFQWLPVRGRSRVTVWDRPAQAVFESLGPTWPLRLIAMHSCEAHDGTTTRYTWSITVEHGAVGRLIARRFAGLVDKSMDDQSRALATWLDANPGAASFAQL